MANKNKWDVRKCPTATTLSYIQGLINYKRTHIQRERKRLEELEIMEDELLKLVRK